MTFRTRSRTSSRGHLSAASGVRGVYAVAALGCCAVKIGWSKKIASRVQQLAVAMPFNVVLIGWIETDDESVENDIHMQLREWHVRGEWFAWTNEVRDFVRSRFTINMPDEPKLEDINSFPFALQINACHETNYDQLELLRSAVATLSARCRRVVFSSLDDPAGMTLEDFASYVGCQSDAFGREYWRLCVAETAEHFRFHSPHLEAMAKQLELSVNLRLIRRHGSQKVFGPVSVK